MDTNSTAPIPDLCEMVKDTYIKQIELSIKAVELFNFENFSNELIRLYVCGVPDPDMNLLISDKFYIWRAIWKAIMKVLYADYLPARNYEFEWKIEISPYTLSLCDITSDQSRDNELQILERLLGVSDLAIENDYYDVLDKIGMRRLGFAKGLEDLLPADSLPPTRIEQLNLLFRLMTFPPLEELATFFYKYGLHVNRQIGELSAAFPGINLKNNLGFNFQGSIGATFFNIDHSSFRQRGLYGIEQEINRPELENEFKSIKEEAARLSELMDVSICPCCGEEQEINLPIDAAEFLALFRNRAVAKPAGLLYAKEFAVAQRNRLADAFLSVFQKINEIDKPDCLILVEGESEEVAIPLISARNGFLLSGNGIKVYNARSKQKVEADFVSYKSKFPKMKMICLLDSDAKKEAENIRRMIDGKLNKYHIVHIGSGCFEDLFNLSEAVQILNQMYPSGEDICESDFDENKDFGTNVSRILHMKKLAKFDKVKFATAISVHVDMKKLPLEIKEILRVARKFTTPRNFVAEP